jgi:hypothetical protein
LKEPHPFDSLIPLFLWQRSTNDLAAVGSCVWVDIEGEQFLLTAAHVTDHRNEDQILLLPVGDQIVPIDGMFAEIGRHGERSRESLAVDAAYFHVRPEMAERLRPQYFPIGRVGIDMLDQFRKDDLYSIAGYPAAAAKITGDGCSAEFFGLIGAATHETIYRKLGYLREVHVLIKFNVRRSRMIRGSATTTPEPWGMSGGGIFSWPRDANPFEPNPNPRLVGIVTDWNQRRAIFIGTQIYFFIKMIDLNNPGLVPLVAVDRGDS